MTTLPLQQRYDHSARRGDLAGGCCGHILAGFVAVQDTPVRRGGFFDCPDYSKVTQPGLRSRPFLIQIARARRGELAPFDQYGVRYRLVTHNLSLLEAA